MSDIDPAADFAAASVADYLRRTKSIELKPIEIREISVLIDHEIEVEQRRIDAILSAKRYVTPPRRHGLAGQ